MEDIDKKIMDALEKQIHEAMKTKLKIKNPVHNNNDIYSPFFISVTLKEILDYEINAINGSINKLNDNPNKRKRGFGELRVGSYGQGCGTSGISLYFPYDNDISVIKRDLWSETNVAIHEATKELIDSISDSIGYTKEHKHFTYLSKENPNEYFNSESIKRPDMIYWQDILRDISGRFIKQDNILHSEADFSFDYEKRYFINSEGTKIIDSYTRANLSYLFKILGEDTLVYEDRDAFWSIDEKKLPSRDELIASAEKLLRNLNEIKDAPFENAGTFPSYLDEENHMVIWHESFGHGTEGHRNDDDDDGVALTYSGKVGERIAPDFFTVYDDPTIEGLDGSYKFDAEGVPGQRVILIENGILKDYLHSRESAGKYSKKEGTIIRSNGHARTGSGRIITPRMSNIIVESSKQYPVEELYEMVIKECLNQGKDYGLIMEKTSGGYVDTEESYFHTVPRNIFRLYTNGKKERVKGLYLVSTPLQILENIVATSDTKGHFNGLCGSESGDIPATETGPGAFIRSVEFGKIARSEYDLAYPTLSDPPER